MRKTEFEAIVQRNQDRRFGNENQPQLVMVCVDVFGVPIDPAVMGEDFAASFKARCESVAAAVRDRAALLKFIDDAFEIEWPEDRPAAPEPAPATE